jgi:hypothetical protein
LRQAGEQYTAVTRRSTPTVHSFDVAADQPTMRREKVSTTKAT